MRTFVLTTISLLAGATTASAQHLCSYDPAGPGFVVANGQTALFPPGGPPPFIYPIAMPLPAPPPFLVPAGDSTFDGRTGMDWYSNGLMVAAAPVPFHAPLGAPLPPTPIPAAVIAAIGGPVTGMAIDPAAGILWLCSAPGLVIGVTPNPAMAVLVPPFAPGFPVGPVVGLECDGMSGWLIEVDLAGVVYRFLPGGAPIGAPIPPPIPLPGMPADVAMDKSGNLNAIGRRPIYVAAGPLIFDCTLPAPMPFPNNGSPITTGMAFQPYPSSPLPVGACQCPSFGPHSESVRGPMTAGFGGFGLTMTGLPPGQLAVFALDFAFNPGMPMINGVGCPLGLFPGSPTFFSAVRFANAAGTAAFGLPLSVPAGTGPIYQQAVTLCPADPLGLVLTPVQQLWACGL